MTEQEKINISLPSLRVDNFPRELMERIQSVRKSGLTFAPEAGRYQSINLPLWGRWIAAGETDEVPPAGECFNYLSKLTT